MAQPKRKDREKDVEAPRQEAPAVRTEVGPEATGWTAPGMVGRVSLGIILAVVVVMNLPLIHYFVFRGQVPATVDLPVTIDFSDPAVVEEKFFSTGGLWRVVNGELLSPGVKNNPLWLKASLPQDVAVEFNARSMSPEGDIKVELFGDGTDHASGYVFIHGGWNNQLSIIARLDEHGSPLSALQQEALRRGSPDLVQTGVFTPDTRMRVEASPYPVQIGKTYRWRIERRGSRLTWLIDGQKFMEFDDPFPLAGKGHDRFGFSSWEAQLYFDNLTITPL